MERLTERHKYNRKDYISVDSKKYGMSCSNFCTNCGKADCDDIRKALFKLAEYEDLEEQNVPSGYSEWIVCMDRLPEDGETVLATDGKYVYLVEYDAELDAAFGEIDGIIAWQTPPKPYHP